jgi:hypothetical protein
MSNDSDIVAELGAWLPGGTGRRGSYDDLRDLVLRARDELVRLREALDESVRLQSHYASILNDYDGGKRMTFASATAWMDRLRALKDQP